MRRRDQRGEGLVSFALAMVPFFLILLYLLYSGAYAIFWSMHARARAEQAMRAAAYPGSVPVGEGEKIRMASERRSLEAKVDIARDASGRLYGVPIRWRIAFTLWLRRWRFWGGPPGGWW